MKRVVTGHNADGKSVFVSVEQPEATAALGGMSWTELWSSYPEDRIPVNLSSGVDRKQVVDSVFGVDRKQVVDSVFPSLGKSIFRVLRLSPDAADASTLPPEQVAAVAQKLPGMMEHMEAEDPGMHATDSIDYGVIVEGQITLELDDQETVTLQAGDTFVQNGTRHAWRVTEPCTMAVVLVGVERNG